MSPQSFPAQPWKFFRRGGLDQVLLETAYDLWALRHLDQKLWVALGCPVKGLELDEKTLALIDTDGDGRIRVPELTDAVEWAASRLKDPADLLKGENSLPLSAIDDSSPEGKTLGASARKILAGLGRRNAASITVEETSDQEGYGRATTKEIAVLGDATAGAVKALQDVRPKVEDYFARCRLAAFDPRSEDALNRAEADYGAIAAKQLKRTADEIAGFPIARIGAGLPLPLTDGLNPAWADAIAAFRAKVVAPLLGESKTLLTEAEWIGLNAKLEPYETWLAGRTASDLEKLVRLHRDLRALLHNFVNFADFYSHERSAIFKAGTLYLDGRSVELCMRVDGPNPLAAMSNLCIAYCQCTRPAANGNETMIIAACFTQGDSDYLIAGRHGLFYDRRGRDWDAVITSLVDNPISIHQAVFMPYKKFIRLIESQLAKRASDADAASEAKLAAIATAATPAQPGAPVPGKPIDVGTVAALGVAFGAIGTFFAAVVAYVGKIVHGGLLMTVGAFVGLLIVISGPSILIAWLKLRQRTLGPLLDGSGWAINGRVAINVPLAETLTRVATLPPGSERLLGDPFEDKKAASRRRQLHALVLAAVVVAIAWEFRTLWLPAVERLFE